MHLSLDQHLRLIWPVPVHYHSLEWRLGAVIASRSQRSTMTPRLILQFSLIDCNGRTNKVKWSFEMNKFHLDFYLRSRGIIRNDHEEIECISMEDLIIFFRWMLNAVWTIWERCVMCLRKRCRSRGLEKFEKSNECSCRICLSTELNFDWRL